MSPQPAHSQRQPGETDAAYRDRLFREVRARLPQSESASDAALAAAQATASAKAAELDPVEPKGRTSGLGAVLAKIPAAVAAVTAVGDRVRPKRIVMQEADVAALMRGREKFDWNGFQRECFEVVSKAVGGIGLRLRTIMTYVGSLRGASGGTGVVRATYEWIRGRTGMCFETISRCAKVLEDLGLLEVIGPRVIGRSGKLVRARNVYLPRFQGEIPEPSPEVVADRLLPLAKQTLVKQWLASISGLFVRPMGLNTTPLRADRQASPRPA